MSYNIGDMAQEFLPSRRKGFDYEVSVKWKKDQFFHLYLHMP